MSVAEFLGVDKNATSDVMLKAVRIMMRRLHPDKHSGSFADTIRDNFELAGIIKKLLREAPKKIRPTSFVKWLE